MNTFSLQAAESFFPATVADPQLQLFPWLPALNAELQSAWSKKIWGRHKRAFAARSSRKEDRKLAGAAEKIRISTHNHPCSPEYPWQWPSESAAAAEPALEQDGACRYPVPDGLIYRHYLAQLLARISREIVTGLSGPCRVYEDSRSVRVEFMQCMAWVILRSPLSFHSETRDEKGRWQLTTHSFNLFKPLESADWIGQVLLAWLPRLTLLPEAEAQAGYEWLRASLEQRFHNARWLRGLERQLRFHMNFAPGLNRVLIHFARLHNRLEIDSDHYHEFWTAEPFWSDFHSHNPRMTHFYFLACETGFIGGGEDLGVLRTKCLEFGLSPVAWRFLGRHGDAGYRAAIDPWLGSDQVIGNALCYLEWQCRAGLRKPLPTALGKGFIAASGNFLEIEGDIEIDPRIARAAREHWDRLKSPQERQAFAGQDWVEVLVWMRDQKPQFDRNQWRTGWSAIWRRYRRWALLPRHDVHWQSLLDGFAEAEWRVEPLTSSCELALEGFRMRHCVSSYTQRCMEGDCRLFSVSCRSSGKSLATVGLVWRDDRWRLGEVQGKCNRSPAPGVSGLAKQILKRYKAAQRQAALQEKRAWARQQNEAWLAENKPQLLVSRYRGNCLLLVHAGQQGWRPARPESYPLPAGLLEKFERSSKYLESIPPEMLLDEDEWQAIDDLVYDLSTELRAALPRHFQIYRDDLPPGPAMEVW